MPGPSASAILDQDGCWRSGARTNASSIPTTRSTTTATARIGRTGPFCAATGSGTKPPTPLPHPRPDPRHHQRRQSPTRHQRDRVAIGGRGGRRGLGSAVVDELRGKIVELYVALKPGLEPRRAIHEKVSDTIDKEIGQVAAPKNAWIVHDMPKPGSGKIMCRMIAGISNATTPPPFRTTETRPPHCSGQRSSCSRSSPLRWLLPYRCSIPRSVSR